jgi:hypothetical protein
VSEVTPGPIQAISERGTQTHHTDEEVNLALRLVVLNGGKLERTSKQLGQEGLKISRETLRAWRDDLFPRRLAQLGHELAPEVAEGIAGRAMEIAQQAAEAEQEYIQEPRDRRAT